MFKSITQSQREEEKGRQELASCKLNSRFSERDYLKGIRWRVIAQSLDVFMHGHGHLQTQHMHYSKLVHTYTLSHTHTVNLFQIHCYIEISEEDCSVNNEKKH